MTKETLKRPLLQQEAPPRLIKAGKVQGRHQGDLVYIQSMPVSTGEVIMSVIDIFSRIVFLRTFSRNESAELA